MVALDPIQRKAVAVAILLALVAAVLLGAALPTWRTYQQNDAAIADIQDRIERFERIAASRNALEAQLKKLTSAQDLRRYLIRENTPALAAAVLQERVKTAVDRSGGKLISTQILTGEEDGPFYRVTVNVRLTVGNEALQGVIHELESQEPFLAIDNVTILVRRKPRRRRSKTPVSEGFDSLDVRFNVAAYMRWTANLRT